MKMNLTMVAAVAAGMGLTMAVANAAPLTHLNKDNKVSYALGMSIGANFKQQGVNIDTAAMTQGMSDALTGNHKLMDAQAMRQTLMQFQKSLMMKRKAKMKAAGLVNAKAGDAFLAKNKRQPGVETTASGLQYKVLIKGTGAKPSKTDTVKVDYEGTTIAGKVFDSSYKRGKAVSFNVGQVIPGWIEALQLMPVGSTWQVFVPAKLAYGERSVGPLIGANSTLIFKVHLISIKKK